MRPAGRSETESLYFKYPHFDAPAIVDRNAEHTAQRVAIVGAGPIGMTAALALAKEGIASVLLDNKATFNDGSRAICIARPSFYILEQLGAIGPFLDKALGWTTGRTFYRGQQILEFEMPDSESEKFRPMYNLQQQYIEQYLWNAVSANDLIDCRWQSEVTGVKDIGDTTELTVRDPHGEYTYDACWVLACDGAHSPMRKLRGHRLRGENFEGRYVIADIQMEHDYPTIRRAYFDPICRPGGTALIHKQPDNIWRIDYQLGDDESTDDALTEDSVRRSVSLLLQEIAYQGNWELEWWSVYTANTLALDDYRDNRIFFVGDSAHIVPIFGVRGLNNGLADAANIGWKLGWVLNGKAGEELLDSYTPERRGATLDVFANASKSARFMTPNTYGWKLMRDAALSLALTHPFAGELANPRQMTAFTYGQSPAVIIDDMPLFDGPAVGALLPDHKLPDGYVSDQLGEGFTVLCFSETLYTALTSVIGRTAKGLCALNLSQYPAVFTAYSADENTAYLIRPDMHIAARWQHATPQKVIDGFQRVTFNLEEAL